MLSTGLCFSELLSLPDGGQVRLDWLNNEDSEQFPDNDTRPTIVMLPGLTGTSDLVCKTPFTPGYAVTLFRN